MNVNFLNFLNLLNFEVRCGYLLLKIPNGSLNYRRIFVVVWFAAENGLYFGGLFFFEVMNFAMTS